jgi:Fe-S-cluster containining protein
MRMNLAPLTAHLILRDDGSPAYSPELPPDLLAELKTIHEGLLAGDDCCPCVWLDRVTGKCKHYAHRPPICRELEVGGEACLRLRKAAESERADFLKNRKYTP